MGNRRLAGALWVEESNREPGEGSEVRRQAADRRMEVGNAGKKQKDEGKSKGYRCCGIICSASDGDFKNHKSNLGICPLVYSLHRMLTDQGVGTKQ